MNDLIFVAKLAGAAAVFVLGLWIGLGMPGLKRRAKSRGWHASDRLRATWINRVFFRMDNTPRRFDASRLVFPADVGGAESDTPAQDEEETGGVVHLRRPGQD
jgi:hypothetical protein